MADRGPVKIRQGRIDDLIRSYRQSYKEIVLTIEDATTAGKIQKARTMATIRQNLQDLGDDVDKWIKAEVPQYYVDGANQAIQDLKAMGVQVSGPKGLAPINKEAIASLTDETATAFGQSLTAISRNAQTVLNQASRQSLNLTIAGGLTKGESANVVAASVKENLKQQGLSALVDKSGRNWTFDNYSDMLVRTKIVEARNTGLANKMLQNGYDLVQVSNHRSSHPSCARWEGLILSISGATPGYPTLEQAKMDGLFHPRCQHAINVINPDLARLTKAYKNPYNHDAQRARMQEFRGPGATAVKAQNITVYHGGGDGLSTRGTDMFGDAFYVARDKSIAKKFGPTVQTETLKIKPSHILTIADDAEYNKLIQDVIKKYPAKDIQQAIPLFARQLGYDAIEAAPALDPLGGIAILNRNLLKL